MFSINAPAATHIYTLSLHDALPISRRARLLDRHSSRRERHGVLRQDGHGPGRRRGHRRSEEHTSELQSRQYLVCRLLLEKKKELAGYETAARIGERLGRSEGAVRFR